MPKIQKALFGDIIIDGHTFSGHDILLFWDRAEPTEKTHSPTIKQIESLLIREPDLIIVGTGFSGCVKLSHEATAFLEKEGKEVVLLETPAALKKFQELVKKGKKPAAYIHVTC